MPAHLPALAPGTTENQNSEMELVLNRSLSRRWLKERHSLPTKLRRGLIETRVFLNTTLSLQPFPSSYQGNLSRGQLGILVLGRRRIGALPKTDDTLLMALQYVASSASSPT